MSDIERVAAASKRPPVQTSEQAASGATKEGESSTALAVLEAGVGAAESGSAIVAAGEGDVSKLAAATGRAIEADLGLASWMPGLRLEYRQLVKPFEGSWAPPIRGGNARLKDFISPTALLAELRITAPLAAFHDIEGDSEEAGQSSPRGRGFYGTAANSAASESISDGPLCSPPKRRRCGGREVSRRHPPCVLLPSRKHKRGCVGVE